MPKNRLFCNPPDLPDWSDTFSQVVIVESGNIRTIYISGQVAVDENKSVVGSEDLRAQAQQAFKNLRSALSAAGATTADVVKMNIYVVKYRPEQAKIITEAIKTVFTQQSLPASTWLGVESLALEELLIEVDAMAVVVSG